MLSTGAWGAGGGKWALLLKKSRISVMMVAKNMRKWKAMIVAKFGGTSLADGERFRHVAQLIRSDPGRRYVVVSAPGKRHDNDIKITDLLYRFQESGKEANFQPIPARLQQLVEQLGIHLDVEDAAKEFLIEKGYDEKYGARPLRRTIQNEIEDNLAEAILDKKVTSGDRVAVTCRDGKLEFSAAPDGGES